MGTGQCLSLAPDLPFSPPSLSLSLSRVGGSQCVDELIFGCSSESSNTSAVRMSETSSGRSCQNGSEVKAGRGLGAVRIDASFLRGPFRDRSINLDVQKSGGKQMGRVWERQRERRRKTERGREREKDAGKLLCSQAQITCHIFLLFTLASQEDHSHHYLSFLLSYTHSFFFLSLTLSVSVLPYKHPQCDLRPEDIQMLNWNTHCLCVIAINQL